MSQNTNKDIVEKFGDVNFHKKDVVIERFGDINFHYFKKKENVSNILNGENFPIVILDIESSSDNESEYGFDIKEDTESSNV